MKQDDKRVLCVHLKQGIDYFTYVKILMVNKESQRWKNLRTKKKKKKKKTCLLLTKLSLERFSKKITDKVAIFAIAVS